jgi:hypothetical protein
MLWTGSQMSTNRTKSGARPCSPWVQEQWSSDINYIKTHEGWLPLSVVIRLFHNCQRKHTSNGMLSPVDFETAQQKPNEAGV